MSDRSTGKLFMHGRSQAVRLPKEFRLPGQEVKISRQGRGILIEPMAKDVDAWFAALDEFVGIPFMEDGRDQPPVPPDVPIFE
jgi:antitoxin VapB